jgi:hypothetical protein
LEADGDIAQGRMEVMWRTMEVRSVFQHFFIVSAHITKWILQMRRHHITEESLSKVYDMFIKVADESMKDTELPKEAKLIDLN